MAGTYYTDNIGKYLKDMHQTINVNHIKTLTDADPDFSVMVSEYQKLKSSDILLSESLDQDFPRLSKETGFSNALKKFNKSRTETSLRELIATAEKKIQKNLDLHKETINVQSYKTMQGNRDKLIESCLPMVISLARFYLSRSKNERVTIDDLIQAGNYGLVIATDKYLNTPVSTLPKESKFSTYAYFWIRKFIMDESYRQSTIVSGTTRDIRNAVQNTQIISVDPNPWNKNNRDETSPKNNHTNNIWDNIAKKATDEISGYEKDLQEIQLAAKDLFTNLSKEQKRVLFLVFGIDTPTGQQYSMEEAGKVINKSKATVSRMIKDALQKIQNRVQTNNKTKEIISTLSLLHGIDLSKVDDFTMASTY